jgi:hypothetical protein
MAAPVSGKKPGDIVRILRRKGNDAEIENGWAVVRFEPDSGDLVAEKEGTRSVSKREEYLKLNFPGSAAVWDFIASDASDADLLKARESWAKLDLRGTMRRLLDHARTLDPRLAGIQTAEDFHSKIRSLKDACLSSMEVLRLESKRAEAEYNRAPNSTSFESDRKDNLLDRWRGIKDRLSAREHLAKEIMPIMCGLADALTSLDEASKEQ